MDVVTRQTKSNAIIAAGERLGYTLKKMVIVYLILMGFGIIAGLLNLDDPLLWAYAEVGALSGVIIYMQCVPVSSYAKRFWATMLKNYTEDAIDDMLDPLFPMIASMIVLGFIFPLVVEGSYPYGEYSPVWLAAAVFGWLFAILVYNFGLAPAKDLHNFLKGKLIHA